MVGPQGFEPMQVVSFGSRPAICFSLVSGDYHRNTEFLPDRWCMHADERNGTEGRISGNSVAIVKLPSRVYPLFGGGLSSGFSAAIFSMLSILGHGERCI